MLVRNNNLGYLGILVLLSVGFGVGALANWGSLGMLAGGFAVVVLDLVIRVVKHRQWATTRYWLVVPSSGGYFYFVPIWITGLVIAGLGALTAYAELRMAEMRLPLTLPPNKKTFTAELKPGPEGPQLELQSKQNSDLRDVSLTLTYHIDHGPLRKDLLIIKDWPAGSAKFISLEIGPGAEITSLRVIGQATFLPEQTPRKIELSVPVFAMFEPDEPPD